MIKKILREKHLFPDESKTQQIDRDLDLQQDTEVKDEDLDPNDTDQVCIHHIFHQVFFFTSTCICMVYKSIV